MKNLVLLIVLSLCFISCSTEEKIYLQQTSFRNTSQSPLHIIITGDLKNSNRNDTIINQTLQMGESTDLLTYYDNGFIGFNFDFKYMKIEFINNNRGYVCSDNITENQCFINKYSPISDSSSTLGFTLENGIYYYDITQEDYENAHELP